MIQFTLLLDAATVFMLTATAVTANSDVNMVTVMVVYRGVLKL